MRAGGGGSRSNLRAAALALTSMAIFSLHDVVIKTVGATNHAFQTLFFVALFSAPLVLLALARDGRGIQLVPNAPGWVALRTVFAVVSLALGMYAFAVLPLAQTYALLFTYPLWVTLLAVPLLGERIGIHRLAATLIGLGGVLIVLRPGETELSAGHFAALGGAFCTAVSGVIARRLGRSERTVVILFWPVLANLVVGALALPMVYRPISLTDLGLMASIAALSLLANAFFVAAYRAGEAAVVASMQYSQIVWAVFYGWLWFSETVDRPTLIGVAVIIAAGLYIVSREQKIEGPTSRPVITTGPRDPGR